MHHRHGKLLKFARILTVEFYIITNQYFAHTYARSIEIGRLYIFKPLYPPTFLSELNKCPRQFDAEPEKPAKKNTVSRKKIKRQRKKEADRKKKENEHKS